jgi:hypothetical protein
MRTCAAAGIAGLIAEIARGPDAEHLKPVQRCPRFATSVLVVISPPLAPVMNDRAIAIDGIDRRATNATSPIATLADDRSPRRRGTGPPRLTVRAATPLGRAENREQCGRGEGEGRRRGASTDRSS